MTARAITMDRYGRCSRDGLRWRNTATIARFRRTRICGRTHCLALTARSGISPKSFPAITTSRSRPVRRTRSGPQPWSSVRSCAECLACRPMRKNTRSRCLRMFRADWTSFAIHNVRVGEAQRGLPISQDRRQCGARDQANWNGRLLDRVLSGVQLAHAGAQRRDEWKASAV